MHVYTSTHRAWSSPKDCYLAWLFAIGLIQGSDGQQPEAADLMTMQEPAVADLLINGVI